MPPNSSCQICRAQADQSCSSCGKTYYCCEEHQKMDWDSHRENCAPYEIVTNETLGRHMVAIRDILPGEIIIEKNPIILGPKMLSMPTCLGCHKTLDVSKPQYTCTSCRWPLCSEECEKAKIHKDECELFTKRKYAPDIKHENVKQSAYSLILPLRALLMKEHQQDKFQVILGLQSHLEEHKNTPIYQVLKLSLVNLLMMGLKMDTSEDEILNLCSIFDTNCFEVGDRKDGLVNVRAIYPVVSYVSHSCRHNTKHVFVDSNHKMALIATTHIKKGELITTTYTHTLWGTMMRREHLRYAKHFECVCERCEDPTELETFTGSFCCTNCDDKESKLLSINPLDSTSSWRCTNCEDETDWNDICLMNNYFRRMINGLDKSHPQYLEDFLIEYENVLHPTNSYALQVKYALMQLYGHMDGFRLQDLTDELLNRKIEICRELLAVADVLECGYSRFRGTILNDLQEAETVRIKRSFSTGEITRAQAIEMLQRPLKMLEESTKILEIEPDFEDMVKEKSKALEEILNI